MISNPEDCHLHITEMNNLLRQPIFRIATQIGTIMHGHSNVINKLIAAWIAGCHVLLEDYPGTGKTTFAKALARSIDARFSRVQFTPDLLPSDIIGVSIWNQRDSSFVFHEGPIFTNVLLADEINRASPRTQSALLEAMAEVQVTVDGLPRTLPDPYFVIATQNPIESHGTYPLPEAQLDRFGIRLSLGYVSAEDEIRMLDYASTSHPVDQLTPCATLNDLRNARRAASEVIVSPVLREYIVGLAAATRRHPEIRVGASPRASITLYHLAQVLAWMDGRDYVIPDDIQEVVFDVLLHRLVIDSKSHFSGITARDVVSQIVANQPLFHKCVNE